MNIDREKIIKSVTALVALFIVVFGLTRIRENNSLTLTDYASQHPELTEEMEETEEKTSGEDSYEDDGSDAETNENLQDQDGMPARSSLTGASLNSDTQTDQRITYVEGFYYEPLSDNLKRYITGISYPSQSADLAGNGEDLTGTGGDLVGTGGDLAVTYGDLRYVHIWHYDFDGNPAEGELICNEAIAQDLVEIFYELYRNEYQLEKVLLIDEYDGDDTASMEDNNTSCFNYRLVEGSTSLSKHAYGLAVDVNPLYNPYITYETDGSENISPASAAGYSDRSISFPYKIDENDLCYKLFTEHGFTWGGNWNSCKDYQHFQKTID